jgi:serine/threonine protein phosphatase PrpC
MTELAAGFKWQVIGRSVRGASHARTGLPNQDAIGWIHARGLTCPLIVAVSDGHGSAKYFRSHIGSRLAVEIALKLGEEFLNGQPDLKNLSAIKRTAEERLPQEMARRWRAAIEGHLESNPISAEESSALEASSGAAAREALMANPTHAYGATILTVLVEESFIVYLQLGDGDIVLVSEQGEVERPLPKDERLFANETTSLISRDAWSDFRFGFQSLVGAHPALILVSTDGYANSFVNEEAFFKVGKDVLEILLSEGIETVERSLETWLVEASEAGSGDDITLAIICRLDALSKTVNDDPNDPVVKAEDESTGRPDSEVAQSVSQSEVGVPPASIPEGEKQ